MSRTPMFAAAQPNAGSVGRHFVASAPLVQRPVQDHLARSARDSHSPTGGSLGHRLFFLLVLLWAMIVALSAGGTSHAADMPAPEAPTSTPVELSPTALPDSGAAHRSRRQIAPELQVAAWIDPTGPVTPPRLRGKVQLVVFWGVNCRACVQKIPKVRQAAARYADTDLVVIGLHNAQISPSRAVKFARDRRLNYPIAIDRTAKNRYSFGMTSDAYQVPAIPHAAVIGRDGTLQFVGQFEQALQKAEALLKVVSSGKGPSA